MDEKKIGELWKATLGAQNQGTLSAGATLKPAGGEDNMPPRDAAKS